MKTNPRPLCGIIRRFVLNSRRLAFIAFFICGYSATTGAEAVFAGERKLNNLVSELLDVSSPSKPGASFTFTRPGDGWILVALSCQGQGTAGVVLDKGSRADNLLVQATETRPRGEAMHHVSLEGFPGAKHDGEVDRFRLAGGARAGSWFWPGADLQLFGDPALP